MPTPAMNLDQIEHDITTRWDADILPQLSDYIRIPCKSPMFDPDWAEHGYMDQAVALMERWARAQPIAGLTLDVVRLDGRTPVIFIEIPASGPGTGDDTVLLYGHLDKQPEAAGWDQGLGPWDPVVRDDKLYGRGSADDGYALFSTLAAIAALQAQGLPHARCVVLIESCEESGSYDLPAYIEHLAPRIRTPSLVVCLDSGCANYQQLWCTTSLRGMLAGTLTVKVLDEGVHSGDASGIVPSSFRILRQLLSRLEDQTSGRVLLEQMHVEIPGERQEQAKRAADVIGTELYDKFPMVAGLQPMHTDLSELVLNRTWRPALSIVGMDGLPSLAAAGNVLRTHTAVKLSFRLPPSADADACARQLHEVLLDHPPSGAKVSLELDKSSSGWDAPPTAPWLAQAIETGSQAFFGKPAMFLGEGGSIPLMGMLGELFPRAQFLITGVLGPHSNAHGPNEFLHLAMVKRVTACVATVLHGHYTASAGGKTGAGPQH